VGSLSASPNGFSESRSVGIVFHSRTDFEDCLDLINEMASLPSRQIGYFPDDTTHWIYGPCASDADSLHPQIGPLQTACQF
jgi:hypothetical protein